MVLEKGFALMIHLREAARALQVLLGGRWNLDANVGKVEKTLLAERGYRRSALVAVAGDDSIQSEP